MTVRFFDHLLSRATGQLGPARVRPQSPAPWSADDAGAALEAPAAEAAGTDAPRESRPLPADPQARPGALTEVRHPTRPVAGAPVAVPTLAASPRGTAAPQVSAPAALTPADAAFTQLRTGERTFVLAARAERPASAADADGPPQRLQAEPPPSLQAVEAPMPDHRDAAPADVPPRPGVRPAAWPRQRVAAAGPVAAQEDSTVVHVSIGRVELFAPPAPPAVRAPRAVARSSSVPLADYLRGKPR